MREECLSIACIPYKHNIIIVTVREAREKKMLLKYEFFPKAPDPPPTFGIFEALFSVVLIASL